MRKIAFTFAGRQKTMSKQVEFMRRALELGYVDEWHIWNFARNQNDKAWLREEFGSSSTLLTGGESLDYVPLSVASGNEPLEIRVVARNDAHLKLVMDSGACIEIVFGAFSNTLSLLRIFSNAESYQLHKAPVQTAAAALKWGKENLVRLDLNDGLLRIALNGVELFALGNAGHQIGELMVHTGYGSDGIWRAGARRSNIQLMECGKSGFEGFRFAYFHYAISHYADSLFLKLDDDIVYCDIDALGDFFDEVARSKGNDIISANVINNGVCAHYQGKNGYFPGLDLEFEYPREGTFGKLWESSQMCEGLHEYFLDNLERVKERAGDDRRVTVLPQFDRFSINFVGFRHGLFPYMMAAYLAEQSNVDDEYLMTRSVPRLFGVGKSVFNPLVVAHLSFFKQDETLDSGKLIDRYLALPV